MMGVDLEALAHKQAITEIIYRYSRGMDRMDREMTQSCWHLGGTDDHGALYAGTAEGFLDWLWPVHEAMVSTQHTINNILIDLDGDKAGAESYYTVYLRTETPEGLVDIIGGGRYCDSFERLFGQWKIRHRQSISDWLRVDPVGGLEIGDAIPPNNPENTVTPMLRSEDDYSYKVLKNLMK